MWIINACQVSYSIIKVDSSNPEFDTNANYDLGSSDYEITKLLHLNIGKTLLFTSNFHLESLLFIITISF